MNPKDNNLLDALQIALDAEHKARSFYTDAAGKTSNPYCKEVFQKLAEFEDFHVKKLSDLVKSLRENGAFIQYEGREIKVATPSEVLKTVQVEKASVSEVLTAAMASEREAEERYQDLAKQTANQDGKAMFTKLSAEEHEHYVLLRDAYWTLNDGGARPRR